MSVRFRCVEMATAGRAELDLAELLIGLGSLTQVAEAVELLIAVQPRVEEQSFLAGTHLARSKT